MLPTLCSWMGVPAPLQCDGRALDPFIVDPLPPADPSPSVDPPRPVDPSPSVDPLAAAGPDGWRTAVHWEWDFRNPWLHLAEGLLGVPMEQCCLNVVRSDRWKYVHFATDPDVLPPLLFDLEADPDQVDDLVHDPGHQGVVADRCGELLRWRMRHDERALTGHLLTPEGLVVHRDPHR